MIEVALYHPWNQPFFKTQTPGETGTFHQYNFRVDSCMENTDYCIVWGGLPENISSINCPARHFIYMTDEAHDVRRFQQGFLDQFDAVIACRTDIRHKNIIQTHEINTWHLPYTRDELYSTRPGQKSKTISIVASDLTILNGHKKRYAFVNRLIGHFKDRLDVYGRGFNPVANKWDALADYKYSIAIENSAIPGYFTEKLSECFLADCMPVYYGAPDIDLYFDKEAFASIDIEDYKTSILTIEKLIEEDPYPALQQKIIEQKIRYMDRYHFFPALTEILEKKFSLSAKIRKKRIVSEERFEPHFLLKKLTRNIRKSLT